MRFAIFHEIAEIAWDIFGLPRRERGKAAMWFGKGNSPCREQCPASPVSCDYLRGYSWAAWIAAKGCQGSGSWNSLPKQFSLGMFGVRIVWIDVFTANTGKCKCSNLNWKFHFLLHPDLQLLGFERRHVSWWLRPCLVAAVPFWVMANLGSFMIWWSCFGLVAFSQTPTTFS